ncbi:MAG TPA: hypothetical protein PK156_47730 [Polyangium sp.]|nr:hypothetical protein [Polyangium sp.]
MKRYWCPLVAVVGLGAACSNRLEPVTATQKVGMGRTSFPDISVEHTKDCVAEHGARLEAGDLALNATVEVTEEGQRDVTIVGIPNTAPDFGACMRNVLYDMPIAEEPFRKGLELLKYRRQETNAAQRFLVGHPVVIVVAGVTIVVSEIVLEAGAVTILTAVTVKVVEKAADDVAEAIKNRRIPWKDACTTHYENCIESPAGRARGNVWNQTRCGLCKRSCDLRKIWPPAVIVWDEWESCY